MNNCGCTEQAPAKDCVEGQRLYTILLEWLLALNTPVVSMGLGRAMEKYQEAEKAYLKHVRGGQDE
jgi:hypothetical protein